jgi:serine protease Do
MSRNTSPLLLAATLTVGVLLGLNLSLNRGGGKPLAAQLQQGDPAPARPAEAVAAIPRGEAALYAEIDKQYALFEHVNRSFELVAKAVSPSVVHLVAHKLRKRDDDRGAQEVEETGSGVIVRAEGSRGLFVLTNNHVVADATADDVQIYLNDGRSLRPERLWTDSRSDIAVIKLGREDLPAARLGDSDRVSVGSWVMAIGSPFGLTHSVSQGIISGRGRHERDLADAGVENQDFLQTDAAINPGNSGGPLVNLKGEVIGLNIAILSNGGGNEGVGFSIPINLARWIMNGLITNGRVSRGALGIKLQESFLPEHAVKLGLHFPRGAWVNEVDKASPAALGGIRVGDVIVRFNGVEVADLNHLINLVSMAPIGRLADVIVWRNRAEMSIRVTVGDKDQAIASAVPLPGAGPSPPRRDGLLRRPSAPAAAEPESFSILGLELVTLDGVTGPRLGLPANLSGAVVTKVEPDSPLAAYFRTLDVIHSVGNRPIRGGEDAVKALNSRAEQDHLELGLHRLSDGAFHNLKVRLP